MMLILGSLESEWLECFESYLMAPILDSLECQWLAVLQGLKPSNNVISLAI